MVCHAFQPVVSLGSRKTHHFEALFRPEGGVHVGHLICEMEASGAIIDHDIQSVRALAPLADRWSIPIATNLSAVSLADSTFRSSVLQTLLSMRRPQQLHFEITETMPVSNMSDARKFVECVQAMGCWVSLDDFGAGHFSAQNVLDLRPDLIKIDKSLTHGLSIGDRASSSFVRHAVEVAAEAGSRVVAEGIEAAMDIQTAKNLGIEFGQGYYLGRPYQVSEWLQAGRPVSRRLEGGLPSLSMGG